MPPGRPTVGGYLLGSFALLALCFPAITLFSQRHGESIERAALSLQTNAVASVRHLSAARGELRRVPLLANKMVHGPPAVRDAAVLELSRSQQEVDQSLQAYLRAPLYPGERELWLELQRDLIALDDGSAALLADVRAGDVVAARGTVPALESTVERLSAALGRSVDFHLDHAALLARDIQHRRAQSWFWGITLDLLAMALVIVAATLSLRAVRANTRLLEAHRDLEQQRADELEQFASRVAHDLVSPLGAVSLSLEVASRAGDGERRAQALARAENGVRQVHRIVQALLAFARSGARPEPGARAELRAVVDDVILNFRAPASDRGVELVVGPLPDVAVACAPGALASVVSNLVANALKYAGGGRAPRVQVSAQDRGDRVCVVVDDNGPGLPPGLDPARVFEAYTRGGVSKEPGLGLGLATVKRIAEGHGGEAIFHSSPRGARVEVTLPKAA